MTRPAGVVLRSRTGVKRVQMGDPLRERLGGRVSRAEVEAKERTEGLLAAAERRALQVLREADERAEAARSRAVAEARAVAVAEFASWATRLKDQETRADERARDRIVELAGLLAERLLGRELALDPSVVSELASVVLAEARGAARVEVYAHPDDVAGLREAMSSLDPDGRVHALLPDPSLGRGDLRLHTDVGTVDARLGPELRHLAQRLRGALGP